MHTKEDLEKVKKKLTDVKKKKRENQLFIHIKGRETVIKTKLKN